MRENARSPTLQTVFMVERHIASSSHTYTKRLLWKALPKKVMWQTFLEIIDYLVQIRKIALDKQGRIAYIWNPTLASRLQSRPSVQL